MDMEITCIKGDTIFVEGKPLLKILEVNNEAIALLCQSANLSKNKTAPKHTEPAEKRPVFGKQ